MRQILAILIILFFNNCKNDSSQIKQNRTFIGTVDNHFDLSSTNKIKSEDRQKLEKDIDIYLNKMNFLNSYYEKINLGDIESAKKILNNDTMLSKQDDFKLAYMFTLAKMKELGVLYKPSFQVNDTLAVPRLIFCTEKEINDLTNENDRVFELNCRYMGNLVLDKIEVYQLENYK